MIDSKIFLCQPLDFNGICTIYPPKVIDIVKNDRAFQYYKILTQSQGEIEDLVTEDGKKKDIKKIPTPLEFLLINCYHNEQFKEITEAAFEFFIHEKISISYEWKYIIIGNPEEVAKINNLSKVRYIGEENFFDFQNILRETMGSQKIDPPKENESAIEKRIHAASRKRERIAAKSKKGISFTLMLGAICCMGLGLNPLNIGEISYASIEVLMKLYQQKEKYSIDIDSLMAGADPKKVKPKYWINEQSEYQEINI